MNHNRGAGLRQQAVADGFGRGVNSIGNHAVVTKSMQAMLQGACKSGVLRVANRELKQLPQEMFDLTSMDYSDKKWWLEDELRVVDVSHNELSVLPPEMAVFAESLRSLVASHNSIRSVMTNFVTFTLLTKLDLSHNLLAGDFAAALGGQRGAPLELPELKECDLSHNLLESAGGLSHLPKLSVLNLSHNRLVAFEPTVMMSPGAVPFRSLQHLDLSCNSLAELPPLFIGCRNLQTLDASCNKITLVDAMALAPSLVTLNLRQNGLSMLPSPLLLPNVKDLILGTNKFAQLPDLAAAVNVSFLDMSNNQLQSVDRVAGLHQLSRLDLQNNNLSTLPPKLSLVKPLTSIVLDGNPMRQIRREIIAKGTLEVMKYLRSRLAETENDDIVPSADAALESLQHAQRNARGLGPAAAADPSHLARGANRPDDRTSSAFGYAAVAPQAAPVARAHAAAPAPILTTLGERNGTAWDVSARGRGPMLPECLDMDLISVAAPATFHTTTGCVSWTLAGQSKLRYIDPQVTGLVAATLRDVDVSNTGVDSLDFVLRLPLSICGVASPPSLQSLVASSCRLSGPFADTWCSARGLVRLDLSRNAVTALPEPMFANMASLQFLNLNHNRLRDFPVVLLRLPNLMELQLSSNGMENMPDGGHLAWPAMQLLDVSYNELQTVPFTLGLMHQTLRTIKLEGNRMRWLRQTVLDKGTGKILEFLRDKISPQ